MSDTQTPARGRFGESPLMVGALLLAVLLGVLISPLVNEPAKAEMVERNGHLTTMTARGGNEELLLVIDQRTEDLSAYRVQNNTMELVQKLDLPELFSAARARRFGGD